MPPGRRTTREARRPAGGPGAKQTFHGSGCYQRSFDFAEDTSGKGPSRGRASGGEPVLSKLFTTLLAIFLASAQTDFETQFVSGLKALNAHNLAAAEISLQAASRLQPTNPRVWVALAQTWWKMRKPALAAEAARKAETYGAKDTATLRSLAIFYSEQKKFAKAGDMEARSAALDELHDPAAPARAMVDYLQADQPKKAIEVARATPGWETRDDIRNLLGKAYEADGQILKTIPELQEAIRLKPGEESYYFDLMQVLLNHFNFDAAIQVGEAGRRIFPASAQMTLALGVAYYGQNQADAAIDAFLATIDLDPQVKQPYLFLARLINQAHDKLPGITQRFVKYQEANPRNYLGYFLCAKALIASTSDPEAAEKLLRKSIALNEKYWESHFDLGILLMNRRSFADAAKEFRRSTELNPTDPATHYRLFRALAALGRTKEAEAELARQRKVSAEYEANRSRALNGVKHLEIPALAPR
jgi:tetratricopeptide (TPR) repeat protein